MPELPDVEGSFVLMHFGMTGGLDWAEPGQELHQHDRVMGFPGAHND